VHPRAFFFERSKAFKVAACFCLLGLVAAVDYATGVEISVSAFYPLPVVLLAWFAGRRVAVGMAILAALTQLAVRIAGEPGFSIRPVFFWNAAMELAVYASFAVALGALRDALVGADEAQARVVMDDLRRQLRERLGRLRGNVTVSIGTVSLRSDFGSVDEIMAEVDRLMYEAKERGKNASGHLVK
jgi:hypothetical protein